MEPLYVLIVDESADDADLVKRALQRLGRVITLERVETASGMRAALERRAWDVVISDWAASAFSALAVLALLDEMRIDLPVVIVAGTIGDEAGGDAMLAGARDYVLKDKLDRLAPIVEREIRRERENRRARREADLLTEKLQQSQKMEAIGRLAGGVAHDFNNLLSVILTYSETLIEDLKEGDPMRDDLEQVRRAGDRAADLTRQLLTFSRQQVIEPKVIDLNGVLSGVEKMLLRIVGDDVELTLLPGASIGCVRADPGSIERVIMNLVVNARDAMPAGGKLTVETTNVVLDARYAEGHFAVKPGSYVMLSVSDTGIGMEKATMDRIYDPFFTTKEKGKGIGLGLSTVFGIVQQSGGSVWVSSEVGVGTTFKVYLPQVDAAAEPSRAQASPSTLRGSETILLAEDEDQVRVAIRGILRRHGYTVLEARNAGEALLLCERHPGTIDLLLTDVVMPKMSGPELAKRLAQTRPSMKVLCMSGCTDDAAVRHGVVEPAFAFLQKPITVDALTRRARELLDGVGELVTTQGRARRV